MAANKGRTGQSSSSNQPISQTGSETSRSGEPSSSRSGEQSRPGMGGSAGSAGSATASARGAIDSVGQKATEVTERVANNAASGFDRTKTMVAEQVRSVGQAVERAVETLRGEDQTRRLADRAQGLARKVEEASQYLERKSAQELVQDLDRLARRNPAWFLGTAFVLGLFGARFLKSTGRGNGSTLPGGYRGLNQSAGTGSRRYGRTMRPEGLDQWDTGEVGYGTP